MFASCAVSSMIFTKSSRKQYNALTTHKAQIVITTLRRFREFRMSGDSVPYTPTDRG